MALPRDVRNEAILMSRHGMPSPNMRLIFKCLTDKYKDIVPFVTIDEDPSGMQSFEVMAFGTPKYCAANKHYAVPKCILLEFFPQSNPNFKGKSVALTEKQMIELKTTVYKLRRSPHPYAAHLANKYQLILDSGDKFSSAFLEPKMIHDKIKLIMKLASENGVNLHATASNKKEYAEKVMLMDLKVNCFDFMWHYDITRFEFVPNEIFNLLISMAKNNFQM